MTPDPEQQLTPHFRLREFLHDDDPLPSDGIIRNLILLAQRLETVRQLFDRPILIHSGYRTPAHNKAVGGVKNSFHLKGMAADIVIPGKAGRVLAMHHLALVDDQGLLGDPQAEMHVLLGEQDGGAARAQFAQHLADGGDHDRG